MKITLEQVRQVAALARLSLSPLEEQRYQTQLSAVLEAVEQLEQVDTSGIAPTSHANLTEALLRDDVAESRLSPRARLMNAPAKIGTSFAVPKILE